MQRWFWIVRESSEGRAISKHLGRLTMIGRLNASAESNMADLVWLFWAIFARRYYRGMRFIFNVDDLPVL
jgi:hypothetical protein